jgi:hypothetical protein
VPGVAALLEWWADTRDPENTGLVGIIHGWESGLDASPAYDEAYHNNATKVGALVSNRRYHIPYWCSFVLCRWMCP